MQMCCPSGALTIPILVNKINFIKNIFCRLDQPQDTIMKKSIIITLITLPLVVFALDNTETLKNSNDNIEARFKRLGLNKLDVVKAKLTENGITDDQITLVLPIILRIIHVINDQGRDAESYPRFEHYLENKVELTDVQINHVIGLSKRLARRLQ